MKKIIALAVAATVAVSMVCAQITVGAKGTFGMNLGSQIDPAQMSGDSVFMVNGGGSIFGRYNMPFLPELGVQLELGLTANNGAGVKSGGSTTTLSYLAMDIPLLVTYDIPVGSLVITPLLGMNFSIPLTGKADSDGSTFDVEGITGFIPGIVAGAEVGIPVGPGSVLAGLSYVNDFIPVKGDVGGSGKSDLLTRRNLNLSVGYALKF